MATTISVADDVYEWMKREKKDRSFSEFLRDIRGKTSFEEIEGSGFSENWGKVDKVVSEASEESWEKIEAYE